MPTDRNDDLVDAGAEEEELTEYVVTLTTVVRAANEDLAVEEWREYLMSNRYEPTSVAVLGEPREAS